MTKKHTGFMTKAAPYVLIAAILMLWELASASGLMPAYMLPSPTDVVKAMVNDAPLLAEHAKTTLVEGFLGLTASVILSFVTAALMDRYLFLEKAVYPLLVVTQTIPTVAIAPLLVLWLSYDIAPKVALVIITCFFPLTISLLTGFANADRDAIRLMKAMGATHWQIFWHIKLKSSMTQFFSGLRVATSYAIVGAVISEWLGGLSGLGVYMTRVKKSYAFDKMFAVIFLISFISLILMKLVDLAERQTMPWNYLQEKDDKRNSRGDKNMKKKLTVGLLAIAMIFGLIACGGNEAAEGGMEKITFVLDWTPNTNHTGLYVAQANGYFEELGLDVEIIQPTEDSATLMVASGAADFGITCQDTMAPSIIGENALPIKAVAALLQHNTSGIISLKETGIDRPANMAGHNYATWDMPVEQAMIRSIVEKDGGVYEEIELIPSMVYDTITALNSDIDAIWIFYAWDGIATEVKGLETNYLDFGQLDPAFDYYTPVIISSDQYLAENEETAKKFLEAAGRGYEFAIAHPEEAAEILLEAAPELDRDIVMASQEWIADQYKAEVERWGYIEPARWDLFYQWLTDNGLSEEPIAPGTGFTNDYLPE